MTKTATPTVLIDGQTTSFTLIVRNAEPSILTNASVRDVLPSGLFGMVLLSATSANGGMLTASAVSSSLFNGTLMLPADSTVAIVQHPTAGGVRTQVNQASVTAPIGIIDPSLSDNTNPATVTITVSTLIGITKSDLVALCWPNHQLRRDGCK